MVFQNVVFIFLMLMALYSVKAVDWEAPAGCSCVATTHPGLGLIDECKFAFFSVIPFCYVNGNCQKRASASIEGGYWTYCTAEGSLGLSTVDECVWNYGIPGSINNVSPIEQNLDFPSFSQQAQQNKGKDSNPFVKIVGGGISDTNEYPWQVKIIVDENFICGGTIIGREWVLTAAHCVGTSSATVYAAYDAVVRNGVGFVENIAYSEVTLVADIALLKIEPLPCDHPHINAISIGKSGFDFNGCTAFITGYGVIDVDTDEMPYYGDLMELSTRVYDAEICNSELYFSFATIPDLYSSQICADSNKIREDACFGDSGGPLSLDVDLATDSHEYVQIGVVSFGYEYNGLDCNGYGVYTYVSYYEEWIKQFYPGANFKTMEDCDREFYVEGGGSVNWAASKLLIPITICLLGMAVSYAFFYFTCFYKGGIYRCLCQEEFDRLYGNFEDPN